ncbi:hypothetical protein GPA10_05015 [Streptomyces sp. p1417]|uniref:GIY-YIG nuclease family protein n=1 Tax=Streptomyces typhae TaxID=2681492 RepID=A0A6L6WUW1_9ACTN|nr:GIY-YIG nuclease family protein [Streptomyces typhae]MVO84146.1 hypothetical protein [Streptomyces typhae]
MLLIVAQLVTIALRDRDTGSRTAIANGILTRMSLHTTHFPLRKLDRDAPVKYFLEPETTHPEWVKSCKYFYVYRFYSSDRRPLYIGITSGAPTRWDAHRKRSAWWPEVEYVAVSFYPSYSAIQVAEKAAIRSEKPQCNRQFVRGPAHLSLHLHGQAEEAAALLFRDADASFISELAHLLTKPERFPQPEPPPAARLADDAASTA